MKARIHKFTPPKGIAVSGIEKSEYKIIAKYCAVNSKALYLIKKQDFESNVKISEIIEKFPCFDAVYSEDISKKRFLLISGESGNSMSHFLDYIKLNDIIIDYKCCVTQTNAAWEISKLYENVAEEHRALHS